MSTRITPSEPFPEDLQALEVSDVEVLNSKLHRELEHEYAHEAQASPETEIRLEEVTEELDRRDTGTMTDSTVSTTSTTDTTDTTDTATGTAA